MGWTARITVTHGFLQLVLIYRDNEGGRPLLPWLLGTEAVEHIFGMCHQIVKAFMMLNFHLMIPKLFIKLWEAFLSSHSPDGRAHTSGYSHTHTNTHGIDLITLSTYPINEDIQDIVHHAYNEAHLLFVYLRLTAEQLYSSTIQSHPTHLPSILSWWADKDLDDLELSQADDSDDSESVCSSLHSSDDYQAMLDKLEDADLSPTHENELMDYWFAAIALSIDD
jgi:hypothetical protein